MLCRACGSEMDAAEFCPECNESVLWKCSSCDRENDRSIHTYHPVESEGPSSRAASVMGAILTMVSGVGAAITL
jgi:ribosome-binding protein aMBF1 (putative translation factor)